MQFYGKWQPWNVILLRLQKRQIKEPHSCSNSIQIRLSETDLSSDYWLIYKKKTKNIGIKCNNKEVDIFSATIYKYDQSYKVVDLNYYLRSSRPSTTVKPISKYERIIYCWSCRLDKEFIPSFVIYGNTSLWYWYEMNFL